MTGRIIMVDTECFNDYWLCAFKDIVSGRVVKYERSPGVDFDGARLDATMRNELTVGFNSNSYDLPMIYLAISGASPAALKQASDRIITQNLRPWDFTRLYDIAIPKLNHIDLIEIPIGQHSLKMYGGKLHAPLMQDLPFEPSARLTREQMNATTDYCINDLDTTALLFNHLRPQIDLRAKMSEQYGEELRSKSDAQVAEAVIKREVKRLSGSFPEKPFVAPGTKYSYRVPGWLTYTHSALIEMLDLVRAADFVVTDTGKVEMPPALEGRAITINGSVYRMGIGGLHSSESSVVHYADDETSLIDRDVASYYPAIILNEKLAPKHIGQVFLDVYRGIVQRRLAAKRAGQKVDADTLKIVVNGSFGKLGSKWSALYSPDLMIQVTVTGQLALLMLIEWVETAGIPVVSANTDGLVIKCPKDREDDLLAIVQRWEAATGFETEETRYSALYSRDVNNYIAVKTDGKTVKTKGAFADGGLAKNPQNEICIKAVVALLTEGTPIEDTVRGCSDIRQFVTIRTVQGGALTADGAYLGKAIRWYYARGETGFLSYKKANSLGNHNKVPRSDGARPLMNLPAEFPADVDFDWYIAEANSLLVDLGVVAPEPVIKRIRSRAGRDYARLWLALAA